MKKLKSSFLVLAVLATGLLSVSSSYGQTIQRPIVITTAGPTMSSAPVITTPVTSTVSPWSWPNLNQQQVQQQVSPYRTYWTNPNPNRTFPRLTAESLATFFTTK